MKDMANEALLSILTSPTFALLITVGMGAVALIAIVIVLYGLAAFVMLAVVGVAEVGEALLDQEQPKAPEPNQVPFWKLLLIAIGIGIVIIPPCAWYAYASTYL